MHTIISLIFVVAESARGRGERRGRGEPGLGGHGANRGDAHALLGALGRTHRARRHHRTVLHPARRRRRAHDAPYASLQCTSYAFTLE